MKLLLFAILALLMAGCKTNITLSMDGHDPPRFKFDRHWSEVNAFPFFIVKELHPDNEKAQFADQHDEKNTVLWKIVPKPASRGAGIDDLPTITYGELPIGFQQEVPNIGQPSRLVEGKIYEASGAPSLMPGARVRFVLKDSRIVQVPLN
jgi:hypothetical protein